jgi:hypothetical protein
VKTKAPKTDKPRKHGSRPSNQKEYLDAMNKVLAFLEKSQPLLLLSHPTGTPEATADMFAKLLASEILYRFVQISPLSQFFGRIETLLKDAYLTYYQYQRQSAAPDKKESSTAQAE